MLWLEGEPFSEGTTLDFSECFGECGGNPEPGYDRRGTIQIYCDLPYPGQAITSYRINEAANLQGCSE
jgi:hypothetical protein